MKIPPRALITVGLMLTALTLVSISTGCSSDRGSDRHGARRHRGPPPPPLAGKDTFFEGRIVAELKVGAGIEVENQADEGSGGKSGDRSGRPGRHGGGGLGHGGGEGLGGNSHGGGPSPDLDQGNRGSEIVPSLATDLGPPVMIHLRFTNTGPERVELHLVDFSSPLGNFAVQPDKLTLEPGQSLETEPMSSQLAGSLAEIDVTLVLRLTDKTEKKTILLHTVPAPAAPAAGQPPDNLLPPAKE